jgi:hypothetical protein
VLESIYPDELESGSGLWKKSRILIEQRYPRRQFVYESNQMKGLLHIHVRSSSLNLTTAVKGLNGSIAKYGSNISTDIS